MTSKHELLKHYVLKAPKTMSVKLCLKYVVCALCYLSISVIEISAQNTPSVADSTFYRQKIAELDSTLATNGIGNSRVYNLAAYNSLLGQKAESIYYLQMAVDSGLIILNALVDTDLENARTTEEWPAIRTKIIGNWYKYYPFGDVDYALKLIEMRDNYLRKRKQVGKDEEVYGDESDEYWNAIKETRKMATENGEKLDSLINLHGWPRQNFVGQAQTRAAALILVYSDISIQRKYVHEIEKAVEYGELEGRYLATITDRILIADGEKQRYGTQYIYNDSTDTMEIAPIENESEVDKRRLELGLDSMGVYWEGRNVIGK